MVSFRDGVEDDAAACAETEFQAGRCFLESPYPEIADDAPGDDGVFRSAARAGNLVVAELGGALIGHAVLTPETGSLHIAEFDVHPAHQGRGVGSALLERVADRAGAADAARLTLTTFRRVRWNMPWYAKRGFSECPEARWTPAIRRELKWMADEGYDGAHRVAMERPLRGGA